MSNIAFSKLGLKKVDSVKEITFNDQKIEVKQYLPIQDKLNIIFNAISKAEDENRFFNPVKLECYCTLEIIYVYTNIKFTEKQLENEENLFDLMESNNLINAIFSVIPEEEANFIMNSCEDAAKAIYTYNNSALGILENIKTNSDKFNIDFENMMKTVNDPQALTFVKKLMDAETPNKKD